MVRAAHEKSPSFYVGCLVWCGGCYWLIRNELGVIAFVASILLAIWAFGLRDKFEGETASSAYSVFNKGGKAILGSLTGEQVDQQMRGGMTYNNNQTTTTNGDAPLTTTGTTSTTKATDDDKVKRRAAAAAAAERRLQQQAEERQRQLELERLKQS